MIRKFAVPLATLAACLLCALAPTVLGSGTLRLGAEILLVFAMAQMWNLLAGYAGLLSLGHAAFYRPGRLCAVCRRGPAWPADFMAASSPRSS